MIEWRSISGWPGYEVSSDGQVRSLPRYRSGQNWQMGKLKGRVLKTSLDPDGYRRVTLYMGSYKKVVRIYRLVAETFIPNPDPLRLTEVNHKHEDGDKTRDTVENLEWCTPGQNSEHARRVLGTFCTPRKFDDVL